MTETKECTISFVMLDDLRPIDPPIYRKIPKTKEDIVSFIKEIVASYKPEYIRPKPDYDSDGCHIEKKQDKEKREEWEKRNEDKKYDSSYYFSGCAVGGWNPISDSDIDEINDQLLQDGYWVVNRINKYYVLAFALDGTSFSVYSKDCDPERLIWDIPGEFKGPELTPEDNINPVIALMQALHSK